MFAARGTEHHPQRAPALSRLAAEGASVTRPNRYALGGIIMGIGIAVAVGYGLWKMVVWLF